MKNEFLKLHTSSALTLLMLSTTGPVLANSVDPDQLASEEANWSGSSLFVIKQGSYMSGKCQENLNFFKVRELSGNSVMCQGKMKFCKNVRDMSGNLHFSLMKLGCLVPMCLFIPRHTIMEGYYGFTLVICVSVRLSIVPPSVRFSFPDDNLSKHQWISTKLGMCIDIVESWFGIANGQISSNFYGVICPRHAHIFISGL